MAQTPSDTLRAQLRGALANSTKRARVIDTFRVMDGDGDGRVSLQDFAAWLADRTSAGVPATRDAASLLFVSISGSTKKTIGVRELSAWLWGPKQTGSTGPSVPTIALKRGVRPASTGEGARRRATCFSDENADCAVGSSDAFDFEGRLAPPGSADFYQQGDARFDCPKQVWGLAGVGEQATRRASQPSTESR